MTRDKSSSVVANWKCLSACTLISMASFQYGLDFTMIGGFQAMIGFLQVFDIHTRLFAREVRNSDIDVSE